MITATYKLHHLDMWGNDKGGYDCNQTFRVTPVTLQIRGRLTSAVRGLLGRSARIEHEDDGGFTVSVSECVHGRRHVPKYYFEFEGGVL